jgi:hypothetical protein
MSKVIEIAGAIAGLWIQHRRRGASSLFLPLIVVLAALWSNMPAHAVLPKTQPPDNSSLVTVEVWRIRIDNYADGPIEVSDDHGATWTMIGRVLVPATQSLTGYLAAGYAPIGTVAASAVHGIRIRLGGASLAYPSLINIVPREFVVTPNNFGGHIAGASGIYTNIPSGVSLFRSLSPYVGSPAYLVGKSGALHALTSSYQPAIGDTLVIEVHRMANQIRSILFENREHGNVTVTYADGSSRIVTKVEKPVTGIGRFDGTSYTGVGAVNTNHTCVITISTAQVSDSSLLEGDGPERRGGFQIEPYYHNSQTEEADSPQVMILGDPNDPNPELEGRAPLFFGGINLAWDPADPAHSWICDVQTAASGSHWLPMPQMIGDDDHAIQNRGITAFLLHRDIGDEGAGWRDATIASEAQAYQNREMKMAESGALPLVAGQYVASADDLDKLKPSLVEYYIDGNFAAVTSSEPYVFDWDSRAVSNGEHLIEARAQDSSGNLLDISRTLVYVSNAPTAKKSG